MTKKNNSIQLMRGIAIIAVLMHHSISRISVGEGTALDDLDSILISFHMPTFFIIAGYLYERGLVKGRKPFGVFISEKAKRLLVPYVFWTVILWLGVQIGNKAAGTFMVSIGFPPMSIKNLILNLLTYEVYYVELLWFVYVLFLFFVLHYLIGKTGREKCFVGLCLVIGFSTLFIPYPNIINRLLLWSVFFAFGRLIAADEDVRRRIVNGNGWLVLIAFIALCACRIIINHKDFGMNTGILRILRQLIKYAVGFFGVWGIFVLSRVLEGVKAGAILKIIGDYSYDIYLMHNPYVVAATAIVCSRILKLPGVCSLIIATALGVIIPLLIGKYIIRKNKVLSVVMIGQWR